MDPTLFSAFLVATAVIVVTPGPSVALASSQALRHGPRAALLTVLGDALGTLTHIAIAVAGLNLLYRLADQVLPVMQILGGAYILWLGWQSLRAPAADDTPPAPAHNIVWSGYLACVSNPKAIVFFLALFPGFISPAHPVWSQTAFYGASFVLLDALFILGYAALAVASLRRAGKGRALDRISAAGLGLVGLLLLMKGIAEISVS